jgi:hypothetical protein
MNEWMHECLFIFRSVYWISCWPHVVTFRSNTLYNVTDNVRILLIPSFTDHRDTRSCTHCLMHWQHHYINHRKVGIRHKTISSGPTGRRFDPPGETISTPWWTQHTKRPGPSTSNPGCRHTDHVIWRLYGPKNTSQASPIFLLFSLLHSYNMPP